MKIRLALGLAAGIAAVADLADGSAAEEPAPAKPIHWAFKPVVHSPLPANRAVNPIDNLILAGLRARGLKPSIPADKRTLIRRLYFDITGLPPAPEEVDRFVSDKDPKAWEKLVERLLASPRYGERWARHWLDVVRFAESHGFEMNQPRPNAWPYRDYVIATFNNDKPYDRFVQEQLAGDAVGVDEATGFLTGGPWDQVKSPDPVLTANQRADELHDIVSTTSTAFLGLTVGCARCHDHKFDPIPQMEYYGVRAVFEGVQHGEHKLLTPETVAQEKELGKCRRQFHRIENDLEMFEPLANPGETDTNAFRASVNARKNIEKFAPVSVKRLRFSVTKTTDAEPALDELEVFTTEAAPRNAALAANGTKARASGALSDSDLHRAGRVNDGQFGDEHGWISNQRGQGWMELEFPEAVVVNKIAWGRDREQKLSDRLPVEYCIEAASESTNWQVIASSADRRPFVAGAKKAESIRLAALSEPEARTARTLLEKRASLESRIRSLEKFPMIYGGMFDAKPEQTYRLFRGDPLKKREPVQPAALGAVPVSFAVYESAERTNRPAQNVTEDQQRRLALARWITDPANPLAARVMVNRIWQHHFGEGVAGTPSDFGVNGARPTHPELLDWLAAEFVGHGWSVKHIHRLILTSQTYRQSSEARKECMAVDASSRLLWRFPPRRLEAEAIRDSTLSVSGKLDFRMGGPGFSFFETNDNYVRVYAPRREWTSDSFRRMIYGTVIRQRPDGVFGAFDCPDAGQITPRRGLSTTPLQALNLLNSSFLVQQSGFFADRVEREAGKDAKDQARRAFALAFQRAPGARELSGAAKLIDEQGLRVFCRALLNANEFIRLE